MYLFIYLFMYAFSIYLFTSCAALARTTALALGRYSCAGTIRHDAMAWLRWHGDACTWTLTALARSLIYYLNIYYVLKQIIYLFIYLFIYLLCCAGWSTLSGTNWSTSRYAPPSARIVLRYASTAAAECALEWLQNGTHVYEIGGIPPSAR